MAMQEQPPGHQIQAARNSPQQPGSRRVNWRLLAGLITLSSVVILVAVLLWKPKHDKYYNHDNHDIKYGVRIVDQSSEESAAAHRASFLVHANLLRDQWQPWAFKHKGMLNNLLRSKATDRGTLLHFYGLLPDNPMVAGMPPVIFNKHHRSSSDFTWQPALYYINPAKIPDPDSRKNVDKMKRSFMDHVQRRFTQYHDIEISRSMSIGTSAFTLWASGRITEETFLHQQIPGKPTLIDGVPQKVVPKYQFLK